MQVTKLAPEKKKLIKWQLPCMDGWMHVWDGPPAAGDEMEMVGCAHSRDSGVDASFALLTGRNEDGLVALFGWWPGIFLARTALGRWKRWDEGMGACSRSFGSVAADQQRPWRGGCCRRSSHPKYRRAYNVCTWRHHSVTQGRMYHVLLILEKFLIPRKAIIT